MVSPSEAQRLENLHYSRLHSIEWFTKKLGKRKREYEDNKGTKYEAQVVRHWIWYWKVMEEDMMENGIDDYESLMEFKPPAEFMEDPELNNLFDKMNLKED